MARPVSEHAQIGRIIRANLKLRGIKARVRSSSDCVEVDMTDVSPITFREVQRFCKKYECGHFDGMTDSYNYDNLSDDVPQVKYLTVSNKASDELEKELWKLARERFGGCDALPESLDQARNKVISEMSNGGYTTAGDLVRRIYTGIYYDYWGRLKCGYYGETE